MRNLKISVLETDAVYGARLCTYLSQKEDSPLDVRLNLDHPIQDRDVLRQMDAVLVSSSLMETYRDVLIPEKTLVLDENGRDRFDSFKVLYKYQSAAQIYREIMFFCIDQGGMIRSVNGKGCRVTAVIAPVYTAQAADTIRNLVTSGDNQHKHLYIPLTQVSAFLQSGEGDGGEGVSDLVYLVKQRKLNLGSRIGLMVRREVCDCLDPVQDPEETGELEAEDLRFLVDRIEDGTDYTDVFFDCGSMPITAKLADCCDAFVLISSNQSWDQLLMERMKTCLKRMSGPDNDERIREVIIEDYRSSGGYKGRQRFERP